MNRPARLAPFAGCSAGEFRRMVDSGAFAALRVELAGGEVVKTMPSCLAHGEADRRPGAKLLALSGTDARIAIDLMTATSADTVRTADVPVGKSTADRDRSVDPADILLVAVIAGTAPADDLAARMSDHAVAGVDHRRVGDLDGQVVRATARTRDGGCAARRVARFGDRRTVSGTDATVVVD